MESMSDGALRVEATAEDADCRCLCGSLLARLIDGAVELKCRRCKRTLLVPLEPLPRAQVAQIPARRAG